MPTANNAFNLPLSDGQLIVGKTGLAPVATNITGSGTTTITNGPGTIDISSSAWNVVNVTAPPPINIVPENGSLYNVGGAAYGPGSSFILGPLNGGGGFRTIGEIFLISANSTNSGTLSIGCSVNPGFETKILYYDILGSTLTTTATFVANLPGSIQFMYVGQQGAFFIFQVLGKPDNVALT